MSQVNLHVGAVVELYFQGAQAIYPDITRDEFREVLDDVVSRSPEDVMISVREMAELLEAELIKRRGAGLPVPE